MSNASTAVMRSRTRINSYLSDEDRSNEESCNEFEALNKIMTEYVSLKYRIHSGMNKLGKSLKKVEQNIKL